MKVKKGVPMAGIGMILLIILGYMLAFYQDKSDRSSSTFYENWKDSYVVALDGKSAKVIDTYQQNATVSEGIAYGMLFSVYNHDRETFDALYAYEKQYENDNGFMNWKVNADGTVVGEGGATDAEEDFAYALYLASKQWGDEKYLLAAKHKIELIKNFLLREDDTLLPGDKWGETPAFNPSYVAPDYYLTFYEITSDKTWITVLDANMKMLMSLSNEDTGLLPDWSKFDTENADTFGNESVRVPIRLLSFLKNKKSHSYQRLDKNLKTKIVDAYGFASKISEKMGTFAQKTGYQQFYAEYTLDGHTTKAYQNNIYLSSGLAMLKASGLDSDSWKNQLTKRPMENYYGDSLRLWVITLL